MHDRTQLRPVCKGSVPAQCTENTQKQKVCVCVYVCVQGKAGGGGGASRDSVLSDLAADIAQRLPQPFDIEAARFKYPVDYYESMNTVLTQVSTHTSTHTHT